MLSDALFCIDWVKQMGEFTPLTAPNVAAYIRKREEALRAQADAQPVAWQYRSRHSDNTGWHEWEELKPRGPGQSMEDRVKEMQSYIDGGAWYEMRPLFLYPAPEAAQALSERDLTTIRQARDVIYGSAEILKACHTINGEWGSDNEAKEAYEREIVLCTKLRAILTRASAATEPHDPQWDDLSKPATMSSAATVAEPSDIPPIIYNGDTKRDPALRDKLNDDLARQFAAQQQTEPSDKAVVPTQPTQKMIKAAADAWLDCDSKLILNKAAAALKAGIAAAHNTGETK